jgi:hypothetical protein
LINMKRIAISLLIILFFGTVTKTFADSFILNISYTEGEKSKDSHSSTTSISMNGNEISYSKSYNGYKAGKSETKTCVFTDEQTSQIQEFLKQNNLNKDDSLFQKSSKYKSFEIFCNLTISLVMWENVSKIRVNGDRKEFNDEPLYKNSLKLIALIENYLDKC